ncbi:histidine phosphatase family protein [Nocardioides caldifontis]|uniref:histidine phosphatase family protein n=1 Tax=Nocardioides caldifontis TaxID=2588938 RepID=UPI0011DF0B9F|nr:histidine phosphatase family protein [Nocardioides caldifontis]
MSVLLLVRHGQASFGAKNYDALSEVGHEQSRVLGAALRERGVVPDLVVRGGMRRHEETAAGLVEGLGAEISCEVDKGWDEFDFEHVVEVHKPLYRNTALMIADLARTLRPKQAFQEVFEEATRRWTSGEWDDEYDESFPAFQERVVAALERARELLALHRTVAVVSSGGPIAMAVTTLLGAEAAGLGGGATSTAHVAATFGALNRVAVNTAVTKVLSGRRGLTLSTYNEHAHLEGDRRPLTYR